MNASAIVAGVATYGPIAIAAASAAAATLPQTGPAWWIWTRKGIDFLAFNFGNARNAAK